MSKKNAIQVAADAVAQQNDADVFFINGPIYRPVDQDISDQTRLRRTRKNVILVLVTEGGDADAAFRIARTFQERYDSFTVFVTGYCKSAGTLIALGANELVFTDAGELGPLDVQVSKPDELMETQSGLTATSALGTLHEQAFQAFEHFFLGTLERSGNRISTRMATQVAQQLTCGLFAPIYEHVDPMHIGMAGRALKIATKYGELLQAGSGNFNSQALWRLIYDYPSHGFVIDRKEAMKRLFSNVREPTAGEAALAETLGLQAIQPISTPAQRFVTYLSTEATEEAHAEDDAPNTTTGAPPASQSPGRGVASTSADNVAELRGLSKGRSRKGG